MLFINFIQMFSFSSTKARLQILSILKCQAKWNHTSSAYPSYLLYIFIYGMSIVWKWKNGIKNVYMFKPLRDFAGFWLRFPLFIGSLNILREIDFSSIRVESPYIFCQSKYFSITFYCSMPESRNYKFI